MSNEKGFTLIELMVALVVVTILFSVGVPGFTSLVRDTQQVSHYNTMVSALRYARAEAVKRSTAVSVCPRASDLTCGNSWDDGMLVYDDALVNGAAGTLDENDTVLRAFTFKSTTLEVTATAIVRPAMSSSVQTGVRFDGNGQTNWTTGTWLLCDSRGDEFARAYILNGAGLGRKAYPSSTSGEVVVDASGEAVSC